MISLFLLYLLEESKRQECPYYFLKFSLCKEQRMLGRGKVYKTKLSSSNPKFSLFQSTKRKGWGWPLDPCWLCPWLSNMVLLHNPLSLSHQNLCLLSHPIYFILCIRTQIKKCIHLTLILFLFYFINDVIFTPSLLHMKN